MNEWNHEGMNGWINASYFPYLLSPWIYFWFVFPLLLPLRYFSSLDRVYCTKHIFRLVKFGFWSTLSYRQKYNGELHKCGCQFLVLGSNPRSMNIILVNLHNINNSISEQIQYHRSNENLRWRVISCFTILMK